MENTNETNELKKLFQDEELKDAVLSMIALGYGSSHPDVVNSYNKVMNISMITGKAPMSLIYDLEKDESRLISVVPKNNQDTAGAFFSMHVDLGYYIDNLDKGENDLLRMAYAYARRYATAGLFAQGIIDKVEYAHMLKIFKILQQTTGHSKEFQIDANEQAVEFVLSYSPLITSELIHFFVNGVENNDIPCFKDEGQWWDFDQLIDIFTGFMASESSN